MIERVIFYANGTLDVFGPAAKARPVLCAPWLTRELERLAKLGVDLGAAEITLPMGQRCKVAANANGEIIHVEIED